MALDTRRTLKPGAFWLAVGEFFAQDHQTFLKRMGEHPTARRYGAYEWAYPASVYVDLIQSVGFKLVGVIPHFYHQNEFISWSQALPPGLEPQELDQLVDAGFLTSPGTVDRFWAEVDEFRRQPGQTPVFTEPQVLIFQRISL